MMTKEDRDLMNRLSANLERAQALLVKAFKRHEDQHGTIKALIEDCRAQDAHIIDQRTAITQQAKALDAKDRTIAALLDDLTALASRKMLLPCQGGNNRIAELLN